MRIAKYIMLLFLFVLYSFTSNGQSNTIDSLKRVLQTKKEDTNKVKLLIKLSDAYGGLKNSDSAIIAAQSALELSRKLTYSRGDGYANMKLGSLYFFKKPDEALKYYSQAMEKFSEEGDKTEMANIYLNVGGIYFNLENRPEGLKNQYNALRLFEETKNKKQIVFTLISLGYNYYVSKDYDQSLNTFLEALKHCQENASNNDCGYAYIFTANIYRIRKKYKDASQNASTGLQIAKSQSDYLMMANAYYSNADILFDQISQKEISIGKTEGKLLLEDVMNDYQESLNNFRIVENTGGMGDCFARLAEINTQLHRFDQAQHYADSSLQFAVKIGFSDNYEKSYLAQARLDSSTRNYLGAYESYKKYILYRDSSVNEENNKKMIQERMQYEFDKKEAAATLEQERKRIGQWRVIASLGLLILVFLLIMFYQWRGSKQKKRANLLLQQQKEKVESTLSELRSTQSQLIQSEKMASLGELTAGIAHEIQNPLNFVNNFSDVSSELLEEMKNELEKGNKQDAIAIVEDVKQNLEKILYHGKRADAIVKGMLQHSRTSSGQKEPTDINALANEYLRLAYHGLRAKDKSFNAEIKTDFDSSIGKMNVIPQDIGRVILNLINNALYVVDEKKKQNLNGYEPTVSVSTKKTNEKVEIKVSDNGNGIPQKVLDKIFQPFFTTKPTGQGTGLGLSLAYDIVTKGHGGELKVETREGEGSEFIIQLPVSKNTES